MPNYCEIPSNCLEIVIRFGAYDEQDAIDRLSSLLNDWHLYGVRESISSHHGVVAIQKNPEQTKANYIKEVHAYVESKRKQDAVD